MFKKRAKYLVLSVMTVAIPTLSSCGLSQSELLTRAGGAVISAAAGYLTPISAAQEIQIGQEMIAEVAQQFNEYTANADLVNYVRSIGAKVVTQAERKNELNYRFYILESPEVNAFTIPGGSVFITTEALKYINNEAELAGVLAHEVGHNENRHPAESIKRALAAQGLAEGALRQGDSAILQVIASVSLNLILNGFSRAQEKEADLTGTTIISKLNYEPTALASFLKTLSNLTGGKDDSSIVQLLQTHPGSLQRIDNINNFIRTSNIAVTSPITNADGYKRYASVLPAKVALRDK
jgi:predicted Zn-dependent protease